MDDALLVGGLEPDRDLSRDVDSVLERDGTSREAIRQRWPLYQFEDERADALGFLEAVNGRDVGMVEGGQHLRFPPKTRG